MHARCVREDTKQALKGNLQADGVQSCQTLFVRYCLKETLQADCVQSLQAGFIQCFLKNGSQLSSSRIVPCSSSSGERQA